MTYDLLIIGGGINGCAIAREAALNGWSVLLVEKDDLASHTSSASTKLIHGGLRYLETYEFKLVRESLLERRLLMSMAPHLIRPMKFVLPHENTVRPWWMVRAGLFLYDLLAGRQNLAPSRRLKKADATFRKPIKEQTSGFVYSDCATDDSRLTVLNAVDAGRSGAEIRTRTALVLAKRSKDIWTATLSDGSAVKAKALINASGPWVVDVEGMTGRAARNAIKLVKGSHIVVPRLYEGDHAYMLQQPDKRIVFAINWVNDTTMIGTTEELVDRPGDAQISPAETEYLIAAANRTFVTQVRDTDVLFDWSGVRPLFDDGTGDARTTTRDYVLELDTDGAPVIAIFGGKITTARCLAEEAVEKIGQALGLQFMPATRTRPYPGGDMPDGFDAFLATVKRDWPFLGDARAARMARAYGTSLKTMLAGITNEADMGLDFGGGLTRIEVDWLVTNEWATAVDDILWRRTKIGLVTGDDTRVALEQYLGEGRHAARN